MLNSNFLRKKLGKTKIIFVLGGIFSGIGKGTTSASFANVLQAAGLKVVCMKHDPYLNYDASQLNPEEHGELFVTKDGQLVDLDLGTYERFLQKDMTKICSVTLGEIFYRTITNERKGFYEGRTIDLSAIHQVIFNHIFKIIEKFSPDVLFVEVGGNITDSNLVFALEAIAAMQKLVSSDSITVIFLTYLAYFHQSKEFKVRVAHHSIKLLRSHGVDPDLVVFRVQNNQKVNLFEVSQKCMISLEQIFVIEEVANVYRLPLLFHAKKASLFLLKKLNLLNDDLKNNLTKALIPWKKFVDHMDSLKNLASPLKIAVFNQHEKFAVNYGSAFAAFQFSANALNQKLEFHSFDLAKLAQNPEMLTQLKNFSGIFLPAGFQQKGFDGQILAAKFARENNIPLLAVGLGLFATLTEYAINVLQIPVQMPPAETKFSGLVSPIIDFIDAATQKKLTGEQKFHIKPITDFAQKWISAQKKSPKTESFSARHFHNLQLSNRYLAHFEKSTYKPIAFLDEFPQTATIFQLENHPFYLGLIHHPEFGARPFLPSFVYNQFLTACIVHKNSL